MLQSKIVIYYYIITTKIQIILYLRIFMSANKSSSLSSLFSSLLSVPSFNCLTFFAAARRLAETLGLFNKYIIYGSHYLS